MKNHTSSIAYPCIFCKTKDSAVQNLHRLVANKQCEFDEGSEFWIQQIDSTLKDENDLGQLSKFKDTLTVEEWKDILQRIKKKLMVEFRV